MNAERLHAIATALEGELSESESPSSVQQLVEALRMSVQEPSQPTHQEAVSSLRTRLDEVLTEAPSNGYSPAWREAINEMGIADLLGSDLRDQIRAIFERNEITPSAAADELTPVAERIAALDIALRELRAGLQLLNVGEETLAPGAFEIGFLIPRMAVGDELQGLGNEFVRLNRILGPFLELATGTRADIPVRSISSSAFQVFLSSDPASALLIATTLERLISSYEKLMNIRLAYKQLKDAGSSDEALNAVANDAETKMEKDIGEIVERLLAEQSLVEAERVNEIRKDLTDSLNALANRIDQGYSMEVRAGELELPEEEHEGEDRDGLRDVVAQVLEKQESLKFTNPNGIPILQLPESSEGEEPVQPDDPGSDGTADDPDSAVGR